MDFAGTTQVSQYQKKHSPIIRFFHLIRSMASSLFSLVYLLAWHPLLPTPYISSPSHCLLFATYAHSITACFAIVPRLCYLILVSTNSRFALSSISTLVFSVLVSGFTQLIQINVFITLYYASLYTTTFPVYPLLTTSTLYWIITNTSATDTTWPSYSLLHYVLPFPLIITLVLFIFSLMPVFSTKSFHSLSLLIRSSSVSAITTRSSAYNNSHGKATLNSVDKFPWQSQIAKDLMLNFDAYRPLPHNHYCYHILFLQLFLH